MSKKEWLVKLMKCVALGIGLFFSSVFVLMLTHDMVHLELFAEKMFPIMGIYIGVIVVLRVLSSIKIFRRIGFIFSGASMIYWIGLFTVLLGFIGLYFEDYIRYILTMNVLVLICVMVGKFFYMKSIADELNQGKWNKGFLLVEDIENKPKSEDEFMEWIESYCRKNALDLEVLQYGIPAEIKMDGLMYRVQITEYSSVASGVVPAIEFVRIEK